MIKSLACDGAIRDFAIVLGIELAIIASSFYMVAVEGIYGIF